MERGGVGLLGHKKSRIVRAPFTRVLWLSFHIILLELGANPPQLSAQESTILVQLHPYNQGTPHLPTLEPGVTLSRENVPLAKDVLPGEVVQLLTAGDFTIQLQDTTDLPLRQSYIDSTLQRTVEVSLDSPHVLQNYHGGVPFPLLDQNDPQAGEKLAWNFRYRDLGETFEMWPTTSEVNAAGGVEHFDRGIMKIRFGMHRANPTDNDPQWQAQGILLKNSFELLSPSDREGVMRILTVYDDDTHPSEQLRYSPQTRRIRKEYVNYLTPIGGSYEVLQEESPPSFFHGYLHPYQWNYIGTRLMLVPNLCPTLRPDLRADWRISPTPDRRACAASVLSQQQPGFLACAFWRDGDQLRASTRDAVFGGASSDLQPAVLRSALQFTRDFSTGKINAFEEEGKKTPASIVIRSAFRLADLYPVDNRTFIDPDGKAAGRIDTRPHFVFK
ncbi:MAG: DUF1329 domain-containing protein [Deltaproteobacteria bacterium]|nr:DUF1329 domain-containing protein [Deltaproteobacteria bacterium]